MAAMTTSPGPPLPALAARPEPDVVTPQLCAAAHLQASFAEYVHDELVTGAPRAAAPNWNIDPVTLARHAEQARRRRAQRDVGLVATLGLVLGVLEAGLLIGIAYRLDPWWLVPGLLLELSLAYPLAFAVVWWHYSAAHRSALAVLGAPGAGAVEPPPLDPRIEQVLTDESQANVVVFSGQHPFVGSGTELAGWSLTTDISLGRPGTDEKRATPQPFDALELQRYLLDHLPPTITPRPRCGRRLYVLGQDPAVAQRLFPSGPASPEPALAGRFRRPVAVISDAQMDEYLLRPTASARPYAFFELTGWGGEVVVTLLLRVVVEHPMLFVEVAVCALRPLQEQFSEAMAIPLGHGVHYRPMLRSVAPRALPLLLRSPRHTLARITRARRAGRRRQALDRLVAQRQDLDFSAWSSLRENVANDENDHHFGQIDEQMFSRFFGRRSLDCIYDFLSAKDVDTADFEKQQTVIVEQSVFNARDVTVSNSAFSVNGATANASNGGAGRGGGSGDQGRG